MIILLLNDQRWSEVTDFTNVCHKSSLQPQDRSIFFQLTSSISPFSNNKPQVLHPFQTNCLASTVQSKDFWNLSYSEAIV